jgi:hypothetical protein
MVDKVDNRYCLYKIDVVIGIPTELRSVWSEVRISVKAKYLLIEISKSAYGPTKLPTQRYRRALSSNVSWPGREVNPLLPLSAEINPLTPNDL